MLFDNDRKFLFASTFDTDWNPYIDDALELMGGHTAWGSFLRHTVEVPEGIADPSFKISNAEIKDILNSCRSTAAAYARTIPDAALGEIISELRLQKAFQQVPDNPEAEQALQRPALKPLLDEAAG